MIWYCLNFHVVKFWLDRWLKLTSKLCSTGSSLFFRSQILTEQSKEQLAKIFPDPGFIFTYKYKLLLTFPSIVHLKRKCSFSHFRQDSSRKYTKLHKSTSLDYLLRLLQKAKLVINMKLFLWKIFWLHESLAGFAKKYLFSQKILRNY